MSMAWFVAWLSTSYFLAGTAIATQSTGLLLEKYTGRSFCTTARVFRASRFFD
jgi:hypothetical protein